MQTTIRRVTAGVMALAAVVVLSACEEKSDLEKARDNAAEAAGNLKDAISD